MINASKNQFLWVEKYRPTKIDDCILPENLKKTFYEFVKEKQLPNFLFCGGAGVGKTTVAKALCNEIGAEYLLINGSEESGIDVLRTKIKSFASSISLTESKKMVILDEADYLNANSTQPALRAFIEEFSSNCRFIFTCNFKNRIIEPLQSRCAIVEFKIPNDQKATVCASFFKRVKSILDIEQISFDPKVVAVLIEKHFPDFRRVLNELQRYSVSGKIDTGLLINLSDDSYKLLFNLLKTREWKKMREWVSTNSDIETTQLFSDIFNRSQSYLILDTLPDLVLILAEYQYRAAFVADHEINKVAALTEIMKRCKWK